MQRSTRVQKAQETLEIIESGNYTFNGRYIDIRQKIADSANGSKLFSENEFYTVMQSAARKITTLHCNTIITVEHTTVLQGAAKLIADGHEIGCLNFASAKNPGGGFLNGAQAQEESLAVSSTLYDTQLKNHELYDYNRGRKTYLYSDHMIYSPGVVVFRDDEGELLREPYQLHIITSPATNIGAMKTNNPEEIADVEATTLQRMDKMLALFVHYDIRHLLLGAWGCGVFQNNPEDIARWFAYFLTGDGKYAHCFDRVFFAVYDRSKDGKNIAAFTEALK